MAQQIFGLAFCPCIRVLPPCSPGNRRVWLQIHQVYALCQECMLEKREYKAPSSFPKPYLANTTIYSPTHKINSQNLASSSHFEVLFVCFLHLQGSLLSQLQQGERNSACRLLVVIHTKPMWTSSTNLSTHLMKLFNPITSCIREFYWWGLTVSKTGKYVDLCTWHLAILCLAAFSVPYK